MLYRCTLYNCRNRNKPFPHTELEVCICNEHLTYIIQYTVTHSLTGLNYIYIYIYIYTGLIKQQSLIFLNKGDTQYVLHNKKRIFVHSLDQILASMTLIKFISQYTIDGR